MKSLYILALYFFISPTVFAEPSASRTTEPLQLTDEQMDAITSGSLIIGVTATALALGEPTVTNTKTATTVRSIPLPSGGLIEIGLGRGQAYACCGPDTFANVTSTYLADGNIVIARQSNTSVKTPVFSSAQGTIRVVSITLPANVPLQTRLR